MTGNQDVGMFCFLMALVLVAAGMLVWKKKATKLIPGYRDKKEKEEIYCAFVGKGIILAGVGIFILSVPLSVDSPDKWFALCCLVSCLLFVGMGTCLYVRGQRL